MPPPASSFAVPLAAPAPAEPSSESTAPDSLAHLALGFLLLTACLEAGESIQSALHLILPGNILGLFFLLALLATRIVPLPRVESSANWLLWLLPLLFMPIFTLALRDRGFWHAQGRAVAGSVAAATLLLWAFVGHLAQWLLRSSASGEVAPQPVTPPGQPHSATAPRHITTRADVTETARTSLWLLPIPGAVILGRWSVGGFESAVTHWFATALLPTALWSVVTITVYFACRWLFLRMRWALLHPGLTGILVMVMLLECAGRAYPQYKNSTSWINWLLGPAVVAMAVPIFQLRHMVRQNGRVLAIVIPLGLAFAAASTTLLLAAAGRPRMVVAAGALKSITSPVGYRLATDAHVSTNAALAGILIAGMLGATIGPFLLGWMRVRDERAVGLALGCASHGIGVARALELGRASGAYASLGMSGTAILGALFLPFLLRRIVGAG